MKFAQERLLLCSFRLLFFVVIMGVHNARSQDLEILFENLVNQSHGELNFTRGASFMPEAPHPPSQCIISIDNKTTNNQSIVESNAHYDAFCVFVDGEYAAGGECKACVPGFTIGRGGACEPCRPGSYKTSYGVDLCIPCPPGFSTVGFEGQAYCWPCAVGLSTVGKSGQATCTPCAPYSDALAAGAASCTCVLGASLDYTGSECVPCPAGTYAKYLDDGQLQCIACGPGMFTGVSGASSCDRCLPGTYAAIWGLSACLKCPLNTTSYGLSQTSCEACANETYTLREGSLFCLCPPGTRVLISSTFRDRCLACPVGYYQPNGEPDYAVVANGSLPLVCMPCEPGTYNAEEQRAYCVVCPVGKYEARWGSTDCAECGPLSTTQTSSRQTSIGDCECVPGSGRSYGGFDCVLCPVDFYQPKVGGDCVGCPAYQTNSEEGSTGCDVCVAGSTTVERNNRVECDVCEPGLYQPMSRQTFCMRCPVGTFSDSRGSTFCKVCDQGVFAGFEGSTTCTFCPAHSDTVGVPGSSACTCDLGYHYSEYSNSCIKCPLGFFQELRGQSCQACNKGTYSSVLGSSACRGCASGTFGAVGGLSACVDCPINMTSSYSFSYLLLSPPLPFTITQCTPCPDKSYTLQEGSSICYCPAGTYPVDRDILSSILLFLNRCQACAAGYYQPFHEAASLTVNNTKAIQCEICGPGTFSSSKGQTSCTACEVGKYEVGWGSGNCTACGPFSDTTASAAKTSKNDCKCIAGSARDVSGELCVPCPVGFYQNQGDSVGCLACTDYYTNVAVGSTACDSCLAGSLLFSQMNVGDHYSNSMNSTVAIECRACRPGFYQPIPLQTQCLQCPAGSFSNTAGSTHCSLCAQDSFASVDGSAACSPCPPYSETGKDGSMRCSCALGSSISIYDTCIPCPAGTFQVQRGGPCYTCSAGTYTPNGGSSGVLACISCSEGTFAAGAGLTACTQCPTMADTRGMAGASGCTCVSGTSLDLISGVGECVECMPGYYHTAALEHCTACPGGYFSNQTRSTACLRCPQGMYSPAPGGSTACLRCEGGSVTFENQTSCACSEALHMFNKTGDGDGDWKCALCTPSCDYTTSFLVKACNADQDTLCQTCSLECPNGRYMVTNCTAVRDIICKPCSGTCSVGYFMKTKCSENADITCARCASTCPSERFAATGACTYTHDLICSVCPPGTYVKDNTSCVSCSDGFASTSLDDNCVPCRQGFYSNPNKTMCVERCPPNTYPSSSKGCSECPVGSGGDGVGCYYTHPSPTPANANDGVQACKPTLLFKIEELLFA